MRRRLLLIATLTLAVVLGTTLPAHSIVFGEPDGTLHPNVGALVLRLTSDEGTETFPICSGTLISPSVYLTASHCLVFLPDLEAQGFTVDVFVSFDPVFDPATSTLYPGTPHVNPAYTGSLGAGGGGDAGDVAVVVLNAPVGGIEPAQLPTLGLLDQLKAAGQLRGQLFTTVGYGAVRDTIRTAFQGLLPGGERRVAEQGFLALRPPWLVLAMNTSTGNGGTCFGDSGGPHFLGAGPEETDIVVAVTVTGDLWCKATDVDYRVDTASARAFLGDFVTLP